MTDKKPNLFGKLATAAQDFRNRRQHARHFDRGQLTIKFDKVKYQTLDWSIGGFRVKMPEIKASRGELLKAEITSGIRGVKDKSIIVRVARISENGDVGFQLTEISHEAFAALNELQSKIRD